MGQVELILEKYRFSDFKESEGVVTFRIDRNAYGIVSEDAENIKRLITENLGKWENLVRVGFQLFCELGILSPHMDSAQNNKLPFGTELYDSSVEEDRRYRCMRGSIALTQEEYENRRENHLNPVMQVEEITNQLSNIPKWQAFKEAMRNIKEIIR